MGLTQYGLTRQRSPATSPRMPSIALPLHSALARSSFSSSSSSSLKPAFVADVVASLTPRTKKWLTATVFCLLFICGPLVRLASPRSAPLSPFGFAPPSRTASDGTPRASSFRPPAGSDRPDPTITLTSYLASHFGDTSLPLDRQPHIWLTMADELWARTGTAALHTFVERLNAERKAKYGKRRGGVRDTKLVVMCLDEGCVEEVGRYKDEEGRDAGGGYAYDGFRFNRPDQGVDLAKTSRNWTALIAFFLRQLLLRSYLIEMCSLLTRTWPFAIMGSVSSPLLRRTSDPYPYMEPFMETHDLVAQENDSFDHMNTGWMWIRHSKAASEAWNKVLEMDLRKTSRDQNNFNEVLGTAQLRLWDDGGDPRRKPLRSDFTAKNGLKVHVLDDNLFRSHHFEIDRPYAARDQSVVSRRHLSLLRDAAGGTTDEVSSQYVHMTCGDDTLTKVFVAKAQGFWSDVNRYYTDPPPLMSIDHLSGNKNDLVQLVKILLVAAHYSGRSILPPSHATISDISSPSQIRRIYSAFPLPHLSDALGVEIVEPMYPSLATRELVGGSVLGNSSIGLRADAQKGAWSADEWKDRQVKVARLGKVVELDLRHAPTLSSLVDMLRSPTLSTSSAPIVMLINHEWPDSQHWRSWDLPRTVEHVSTCFSLENLPACDSICRWPGAKQVRVEEGWPEWEELAEK
ncbi:SPOSA6832_01899 [Sporobolomyces salmonicolor]|uniref:SPOSA6832_01899-mRNA-1:cds n=1 Tax=Sporidiobolus salmonicolor TaxID=5005 RepID=A0A0D6EK05_SPOSA|nr:SPOSA6832_01899 [Sporobolomyces salmonicolor]